MKNSTILAKMIAFAAQKHVGQFDKGGHPYILHPLKVMYLLKSTDDELNCIAVGHDLIEDTDTTYTELFDLGMTIRVLEGIKALTKVKGETFDQYKARVKANHDAVRVKLMDLRHNTDIRRLKGITEKDMQRTERYHKFYKELEDVVVRHEIDNNIGMTV